MWIKLKKVLFLFHWDMVTLLAHLNLTAHLGKVAPVGTLFIVFAPPPPLKICVMMYWVQSCYGCFHLAFLWVFLPSVFNGRCGVRKKPSATLRGECCNTRNIVAEQIVLFRCKFKHTHTNPRNEWAADKCGWVDADFVFIRRVAGNS